MLGAASVSVVHARLWILVVGVFTPHFEEKKRQWGLGVGAGLGATLNPEWTNTDHSGFTEMKEK